MTRDRLCNDTVNTGVMGALIGGFALSSMQAWEDVKLNGEPSDTTLALGIYVLNVLAVHACTCSSLVSAVLYALANRLEEDDVPAWVARHPGLLMVPAVKFGTGCVAYLLAVILISWRALDVDETAQWVACGVGVASLTSLIVTLALVARDWPSWRVASTNLTASWV